MVRGSDGWIEGAVTEREVLLHVSAPLVEGARGVPGADVLVAVHFDENHAQALMELLQAAIRELQARAMDLPPGLPRSRP